MIKRIKKLDTAIQNWYDSVGQPWNQLIMGAIGIAIGVIPVVLFILA